MSQQGGSGNNTPIRPVGGRVSTPPGGPGAETSPPPPTPVTPPRLPANAGPSSSSMRPVIPGKNKSSAICPVCQKDMCHDKALNGHIRWHTPKEREAAAGRVAHALATSVVVASQQERESPKRQKLPDLNATPPSEGDED